MWDAIEQRVLQRVLSRPGEEPELVAAAVPAGAWRWAI